MTPKTLMVVRIVVTPICSRASRTHDQTDTRPIIPLPRSPLSAGFPAGVVGLSIGEMLLEAATSSAQTTEADAPAPETNNTTQDLSSAGILLILLLVAALTVFYFLKIQRPSLPDFSGITGRDPTNDNLSKKPSKRTS